MGEVDAHQKTRRLHKNGMPHFTLGSGAESLRALQGSELLTNGCVNIIALDAVRDRAEALWPRKRQLVWDFTEKRLKARLTPHDIVVRIDDTSFLVAISADYATAAQAVCMRVLEEVLLHFIGHVNHADVTISRVDAISDDGLTCSPVDVSRIPSLDQLASTAAEAMHPPKKKEAEKNPALFTSISGRPLRVDFRPRPISSLQHGVMTALYMSRTVTDEESGSELSAADLDALTDSDLIRIDTLTLDYAQLFHMGAQDAGQAGLMIPVSYRTLLNRRGREALLAQGAGQTAFKTGAVFEILDLDQGTPPSRVAEAVSIGKTLARAVFARVPEGRRGLLPLTNVGLAGLTALADRLPQLGPAPSREIDRLAALMKKIARTLIALDASGEKAQLQLRAAGFTHVGILHPVARDLKSATDRPPGATP